MPCNNIWGNACEDENGQCVDCASASVKPVKGRDGIRNAPFNGQVFKPLIRVPFTAVLPDGTLGFPRTIPTGPNINCNRHQAPRGYKYLRYGNVCVLTPNGMTPQQALSVAGVGVVPQAAGTTPATTTTARGLTNQVTAWITAHKGLSLALVAIAYLAAKEKKLF